MMRTEATDLPRPLRPWHTWLGWFDAKLAEQVGELVRRLADLVGPAASAGRAGQPEPDGLGDLRSRGPYERLLASEWLLAEELPDEFMRRAAAAEHLFLAPRMRAAQVQRSVLAVFDCGPRALGAARIAHLAAWILLARRADEQGGSLVWGVLQVPGVWHPADAPARLGDLMRARRMDAGTAAQVAQWRVAIAAWAEANTNTNTNTNTNVHTNAHTKACAPEVWWIAAPGPDTPDGSRRDECVLTVRMALRWPVQPATSPPEQRLEAHLITSGMQRRALLPLPPAADTTALLRGEFRTVQPAARPPPDHRTQRAGRLSLTQGLWLSMPPGHVAVPELGQSAMLVFAVPRPGQRKLAKPRRQQWSKFRSLLALGLRGGEAVALTTVANRVQFWQMHGFLEQERPPREDFQATHSTGRPLPMVWLRDAKHQLAGVLDAAGQLVTWRASAQRKAAPAIGPGATVVDRQVHLMAALGPASMAYAMVWGDGIWLRQVDAGGQASALRRRLCPAPPQLLGMWATVQGYGTATAQIGSLGIAHRVQAGAQAGTVWQIFSLQQLGRALDEVEGAQLTELRIADGERGIGLTRPQGTQPPALVVLSADRRRVRLATAQGQTTVYESAAVIAHGSVCPITGQVALLTHDRQLRVLDPLDQELLLIVTGHEPSPQGAPLAGDRPHELDHDEV